MTVTADSYEAKVSEAIVQMLADCAKFQTIVGASDATAAKSFIIEDDAGETSLAVDGSQIDVSCAFGVVRLGETRRVDRAHLTWGREGDATIILAFKPETNDEPNVAFRRARNSAGTICAELQALVSAAATRLPYATFNLTDVVMADEVGALANSFVASIAVTWRDIP